MKLFDNYKEICALIEKAKPLHVSEWTDEINRWKMEYPIDMEKSGLTSQSGRKASVLQNQKI